MEILMYLLVFAVATVAGYFLIKNVPSLLHTPLMSGMNALSGITVIGAISATGLAVQLGSQIFAAFAVMLAMINVVGGFGVTHRILKMFSKKRS